MFEVRLFTFSKKLNSTKQPPIADGAIFNCNLKAPTDIISPVLEFSTSTNPTRYNYVFIARLARYYKITNWTFDRGLWLASCIEDHLATAKLYIGNTDLYILRASNEYDGNIIDTLYPCSTERTFIRNAVSAEKTESARMNLGSYVMAIQGPRADYEAIGGTVSYYALTSTQFRTFTNYMYNNQQGYLNGLINELGENIAKAICNPLDYIASVMWFPITIYGDQAVTNIPTGWYNIPAAASLIGTTPLGSFNITVQRYTATIPKHPQASTKGAFVNCAPYSEYILVCYPFGALKLNATALAPFDYIQGTVYIDIVDGSAKMLVYAYKQGQELSQYTLIDTFTCQYGVPISVSQQNNDIIGGAVNILGAGASMAAAGAGMASGNIAMIESGIGGAVSGVGNAIGDIIGGTKGGGTNGGTSAFYVGKWLYGAFKTIVDDDLIDNGRPLCKIRKPSALGGFMMVEKGVIQAPLTLPELEAIKSDLESGFYYE